MSFPAPPVQTPFIDGNTKNISTPWLRWLQQITLALNPVTPVTGSRSTDAALTSLLENLASQGIVRNESTP